MASAWEAIFGDSRRSPRYKLRLMSSVLICEGTEEGCWPAVLTSTKDISREGLTLIMPTFGVWYHNIQEGTRLRITLVLPNGTRAVLLGESVYCHPHQRSEYLLGVKLTESEDLAIYQEFIDSLSLGGKGRQLLYPICPNSFFLRLHSRFCG